VRLVPGDEKRHRRPQRFVFGHLVDAALLQPAGRLENEIVQQVQHEVAIAMHVASTPRISRGIDRHGSLRAHNEVVRILLLLRHVHGGNSILAGHLKSLSPVFGSAIEEFGNGS